VCRGPGGPVRFSTLQAREQLLGCGEMFSRWDFSGGGFFRILKDCLAGAIDFPVRVWVCHLGAATSASQGSKGIFHIRRFRHRSREVETEFSLPSAWKIFIFEKRRSGRGNRRSSVRAILTPHGHRACGSRGCRYVKGLAREQSLRIAENSSGEVHRETSRRNPYWLTSLKMLKSDRAVRERDTPF